jgi:alanyl-tRNA synthetase
MTSQEIRTKYLEFFKAKGHTIIPSGSLVPENDPTTLFTTAGMQPLVPFLLGDPHLDGNRLVDVQKCLRTDDIDEVGDTTHHTFFEMLGNWSLGDYFKQEAINYSFEFLTEHLHIPIDKLAVSVFAGDSDAPFDQDSFDLWLSLGIPESRIAKLPKKNNWWGPASTTGPCGPDTEMFYWASDSTAPKNFDPEDSTWVEIWNNVFMEYNKTPEGNYQLLQQKNVDTGMGLERVTAALNNESDNYQTDLFLPIINKLEQLTDKKYDQRPQEFRVIADHIKASIFLIKEGILPANKLQGYILRRLIRRSCIKINSLKENGFELLLELINPTISIYSTTDYFDNNTTTIRQVLAEEISKFQTTLTRGLKEVAKISEIDGKIAFDLFQTYGFPLEITEELFLEKGQQIDHQQFESEFSKHRQASQTASKGMFKGGLEDHSDATKRHHTATHLMNQALHQILGDHIIQRGSFVSSDKLRFDFSHPTKLTDQEIKQIEDIVNQKIQENISVQYVDLPKDQALEVGALHAFNEKYQDICRIYFVGDNLDTAWSKEFCGGPHVTRTGELGTFKITKEESAGSGIRRLYAIAI